MIVATAVDQLETCSEKISQTVRTVTRDRQATALRRPVWGERPHNQMAAEFQTALHPFDIGCLLSLISQEMKGCAIVPDVVSQRWLPKGGVSGNPLYLITFGAESLSRRIQCGFREIEHRYIAKSFGKKAIDQP